MSKNVSLLMMYFIVILITLLFTFFGYIHDINNTSYSEFYTESLAKPLILKRNIQLSVEYMAVFLVVSILYFKVVKKVFSGVTIKEVVVLIFSSFLIHRLVLFALGLFMILVLGIAGVTTN